VDDLSDDLRAALDSDDPQEVFRAFAELDDSDDDPPFARVARFFRHPDPLVRNGAVDVLAATGRQEAIPYLLSALDDPELEYEAAMGLSDYSDSRVGEALFPRLRHPSHHVRLFAAQAMGKTGRHDAVPILVELLGDSSEFVRENAAKALGLLESTIATRPLIEALGDHNQTVRHVAAWALARIGSPEAVDALLTLATDPSPGLRWYAENPGKRPA